MDFHLNTPNQLLAKICAALSNLPNDVGLSSEDVVVVAFSGGPDSTALLLALSLLSKQLGFTVTACHVNHRQRGQDSELDEQFCRQLCERLSLPLAVYHVPTVDPDASEASLRATRYDFLFHCARSANSKHVVLAHNSSDQVETLLFRIFRGTSSRGLTGMRNAHLMDDGIWLLRPMLTCSRVEVDDFLKLNNIAARIDASNLSDKFARNFLRNQVIPLCLTRFPSMERQIERLRDSISVDESYLDEATSRFFDQLGGCDTNFWPTKAFLAAHLAIQRRILAKSLECRNIEVSFERVQTILNMMANPSRAKRTTLNIDWDIDVSTDEITWINKHSSLMETDFSAVSLILPGRTMLLSLGLVFTVEPWVESYPIQFPKRNELAALADLSFVEQPLLFRKMTESDRISPLGMSQSVSLRRYLRSNNALNCSLDNTLKNLRGLVLSDQSEVLWVPSVGLSEKIKVRNSPTHRLSISTISSDFITA